MRISHHKAVASFVMGLMSVEVVTVLHNTTRHTEYKAEDMM